MATRKKRVRGSKAPPPKKPASPKRKRKPKARPKPKIKKPPAKLPASRRAAPTGKKPAKNPPKRPVKGTTSGRKKPPTTRRKPSKQPPQRKSPAKHPQRPKQPRRPTFTKAPPPVETLEQQLIREIKEEMREREKEARRRELDARERQRRARRRAKLEDEIARRTGRMTPEQIARHRVEELLKEGHLPSDKDPEKHKEYYVLISNETELGPGEIFTMFMSPQNFGIDAPAAGTV